MHEIGLERQEDELLLRPYVICHMGISLDGRVTGDFLSHPACAEAVEAYYQVNRSYAGDAFACGRVTMEGSFTGGFQPDLTPFEGVALPAMDYVADGEATLYAIAFDRFGRLGWKAGRIEDEDPGYGNAHIVEVLCEGVSPAYLAYLRHVGVSYIFAGRIEDGEARLDLPLGLHKLCTIFGIRKLLLEGGSILNGAFQREDLVDELSLIVMPCTASEGDLPLFSGGIMSQWELAESRMEGGTPHLRYIRQR